MCFLQLLYGFLFFLIVHTKLNKMAARTAPARSIPTSASLALRPGTKSCSVSSMQAVRQLQPTAGSRNAQVFFRSMAKSQHSSAPNAANSRKCASLRRSPSPWPWEPDCGNRNQNSSLIHPLIAPDREAGSRELPQINRRLAARRQAQTLTRPGVRAINPAHPDAPAESSDPAGTK